MTTRTGGPPRWPCGLSRRWTPLASATKTGSGPADEQAALDHPDDAADALLQPRRVGDRAEAAVEDAVAAVGDEGLARRRQPQLGDRRPAPRGRALVTSRPKVTTSTGTGACVPRRSTSLAPSTMMASRRLAAATIFSRSKAPPSPLIRFSVPRSTSSAPSMVRSIWRCSAKDVERNARGLGLGPRMLGGGNADEAQALAMAPRQRLDGEGGGRAGAETRRSCRPRPARPPPRPPARFSASRSRCIAAHDLASPAVALARMAAIAAA